MSILNELIETEYKTEYINNHKTGKLMDKKNYSVPKIYPKIIEQKRLSAFTEKQKEEILQKYKRWYVYYYFRNEEGKMVKQPPIFFKINQIYKDFDSRYTEIHTLRNIIERILKNGYTPNAENTQNSIINEQYTTVSALDFALKLKKNSVSENSFIEVSI